MKKLVCLKLTDRRTIMNKYDAGICRHNKWNMPIISMNTYLCILFSNDQNPDCFYKIIIHLQQMCIPTLQQPRLTTTSLLIANKCNSDYEILVENNPCLLYLLFVCCFSYKLGWYKISRLNCCTVYLSRAFVCRLMEFSFIRWYIF